MKFVTTAILTTLLTGASLPLAAGPLQVLDHGMDGDTRHYLVVCPDGRQNSITVKFNIDPASGQPQVKTDLSPLMTRGSATIKPTTVIDVCVRTEDNEYSCLGNAIEVDDAAASSCK